MGERPGKNGFTQKQFGKADSQTKSLELGFLFKLLKIKKIYLIWIRIPIPIQIIEIYLS